MELEDAIARIAELEGQVSALMGERDAAAGRAAELEAAQAARPEAQGALAEAQTRGLAHLRRALLAEHVGQVVPELISGESEEALLASVEVAKQAYARALETARTALAGQTVPAGAPSARTAPAGAGLSPLELIESGLRK